MPLEFSSERLLLRELQPQDTHEIFILFSDQQTVEHTEWEPFQTLAQAEWLVNWARNAAEEEPRSVFAWAVCWRDESTTDVLGIVTLTIRPPSSTQAEIGYIINRSVWGRGIATEAVRAVVSSAFGDLGLHRVTASCDTANDASVRALEKIGMRREGCLVRNKWEKGRLRDTAIFALLEDDVCGSV